MNYPENYKDFLRKHSFEDTEYMYSNGKDLILTENIEGMIEHYFADAAKKQTPQKIIRGSLGAKYCPICNAKVGFWCNKMYCDECGQSLDWSKDDDSNN